MAATGENQTWTLRAFSNGMIPALQDESKGTQDSYIYAENIRIRGGMATPIKGPQKLTDPRWGKIQGIFTFGDWLLVFADGLPYVSDRRENSVFKLLTSQDPEAKLDPKVDVVYFCAVPLSYQVYKRQLSDPSDVTSEIKYFNRISDFGNGFFSDTGGGIPCIVVQDGINQPLIIHPDPDVGGFRCRKAQDYNGWTPDNPEYVPIGYQMAYVGKILYVVLKGRFQYEDRRLIGRSTTGRPLDFMVNIRSDGSKEPNEIDGDSRTTSHAVDFDPITHISRGPTSSNGLIISTRENCWILVPTQERPIFGEPSFDEIFVANTGAVSQEAVVEKKGQISFVSTTGLRSFDAVAQDKAESRNDYFGSVIQPLLTPMQEFSATSGFDDYLFYSVSTVYGPGIVVFDTALSSFVCLDRPFPERVVQFTKMEQQGMYKLYCRTDINNLYELFVAGTLTASIYVGDFSLADPSNELKPVDVWANFAHTQAETKIMISVYVNKVFNIMTSYVLEKSENVDAPAVFPYGTIIEQDSQTYQFDAGRCKQGFRFGLWLVMDGPTSLSYVTASARVVPIKTSYRQKGNQFREVMK